jgi:hypothetical protein
MFDTMTFAELDAQHVELLPPRTVLSLLSFGGNGNGKGHGHGHGHDNGGGNTSTHTVTHTNIINSGNGGAGGAGGAGGHTPPGGSRDH